MTNVESAEYSAASRVPQLLRQPSDTHAELFSAVFDAARQSASLLAGLMEGQGKSQTPAMSRLQQSSQTVSASKTRRLDDEGGTTASDRRPSRLERMEESVSSANETAAKPRETERTLPSDEAGDDDIRQKETNETESASREEADAEQSSNVLLVAVNGASVDGGCQPWNETFGSSQTQVDSAPPIVTATDSDTQVGAAPLTMLGGGESFSNAETAVGAHVVTHGDGYAAMSQQQNPGGNATSGEQSSGSAQARLATSTGTTAKGASASLDFQSLMETAGQVRGRLTATLARNVSGSSSDVVSGRGVRLNEADSVNELSQIVRANMGSRNSSLVIRLDPPELGQLRIDVRMHEHTLTLRLEAETRAGQEALQTRLDDLRASLEQHGIQLNRVDVELRSPTASDSQSDGPGMQEQSTPQEGDGTSGQAPDHTGQGGGEAGGSSVMRRLNDTNESVADLSAETSLADQGRGGFDDPAETGVDLIV